MLQHTILVGKITPISHGTKGHIKEALIEA